MLLSEFIHSGGGSGHMKFALKIILFLIVMIVTLTLVIIAYVFILGDMGLPSEAVGAVGGVFSIAVMGFLYWLFFGKRQLEERKRMREREVEALKLMSIPNPPPVSQMSSEDTMLHESSGDDTPLFEISTDYTPADIEKATVFISLTNSRSKSIPRHFPLIFVSVVAALTLCAGFIFPELWRFSIQLIITVAAGAVLYGLAIWGAKRNTKKNPQSGKLTYHFYKSYYHYQITNHSAKTEIIVPYSDIITILRSRDMYFIFTDKKMHYFIPCDGSFDAGSLEQFLLERFPSKYSRTDK